MATDEAEAEQERTQKEIFDKKKKEMQEKNKVVMDCSDCLIIFSDPILHRIHMSMHSSSLRSVDSALEFSSSATIWKCAVCNKQCSNRREFQSHTIEDPHLLFPQGVVVPFSLPYQCGLPDLASLCEPDDLLHKLTTMIKETNNNNEK